MKGGSEWDTMATGLTRLAGAYGTQFPVPRDAVVRRFNDKETAEIAEEAREERRRAEEADRSGEALAPPAPRLRARRRRTS